MSASLVGSEMCIRDRSPPCAWAATARWPSPAQLQLGKASLWEGAGGGATAVSYTHLTLPTICSV
eukprot:2457360-Alexandrium_andersonii.AAC.1